MAKTFRDNKGETVVIDKQEMNIDLETHEDIITGDVTTYLVLIDDYSYEVSKEVYEAVEQYI